VKVEFFPDADEEFREAARYYESEAAGVGLSFIAAVHKAVDEIADFLSLRRFSGRVFARKCCVTFRTAFSTRLKQTPLLLSLWRIKENDQIIGVFA